MSSPLTAIPHSYVVVNGTFTETGELDEIAIINLTDQFCEALPVVLRLNTTTLPDCYDLLVQRLHNKIWIGLNLTLYEETIQALCDAHNLTPPTSFLHIDIRGFAADTNSTLYDFAEQFQLPTYRSNTPIGGCRVVIDTIRNYGAVYFLQAAVRSQRTNDPLLSGGELSHVPEEPMIEETVRASIVLPPSGSEANGGMSSNDVTGASDGVAEEELAGQEILDDFPIENEVMITTTAATPDAPVHEVMISQQQPPPPQSAPLKQEESPQSHASSPPRVVDAIGGEREDVPQEMNLSFDLDVDGSDLDNGDMKPVDSPLRNGKGDEGGKETEDQQYFGQFGDDDVDDLGRMDIASQSVQLNSASGNGVTKHGASHTPTTNRSVEDDVSQTDTNPMEDDMSSSSTSRGGGLWANLLGTQTVAPRPALKVRKTPMPSRKMKGSANGAPLYYDRNISTRDPKQIQKVIENVIAINSRIAQTTGPNASKIDLGIVNRLRCIWISYDGHNRPREPRGIHPLQWDRRPAKEMEPAFYAVPFKSKSGRHSRFVLEYVCEIRGEPWRPSTRRRGPRSGRGDRSRAVTSPSSAPSDSAPPKRQNNTSNSVVS